MPGQGTPAPPPSAVADRETGWVDRLPLRLRDYAVLARWDRPVGTWLLLLPCWWGTALAPGWPDVRLLALFAVGAVAMRGAGCAINDLGRPGHRPRVARTRDRPLASGRLGAGEALAFAALQSLVGLGVLLCLNRQAALVALASVPLILAYPFMKRITWWPQAFLGITFNWGALVGYAAATGTLDAARLALYAAGIAWTLGYDTIYAHQDKADDLVVGVRSTALRLGTRRPRGCGASTAGAPAARPRRPARRQEPDLLPRPGRGRGPARPADRGHRARRPGRLPGALPREPHGRARRPSPPWSAAARPPPPAPDTMRLPGLGLPGRDARHALGRGLDPRRPGARPPPAPRRHRPAAQRQDVFITAAVHHLLDAHDLPFLQAAHEGRYLGARLVAPDRPDAFPYARFRDALAASPPALAEGHRPLATLRLELAYRTRSLVLSRMSPVQVYTVDIIDYPGEWLLDLPLLETSYEEFSAAALALAERPLARRGGAALARAAGHVRADGPRTRRRSRSWPPPTPPT
jgi:4-hydroxybenzoate polyprenyltransferase